jgi:hypothetical protein
LSATPNANSLAAHSQNIALQGGRPKKDVNQSLELTRHRKAPSFVFYHIDSLSAFSLAASSTNLQQVQTISFGFFGQGSIWMELIKSYNRFPIKMMGIDAVSHSEKSDV